MADSESAIAPAVVASPGVLSRIGSRIGSYFTRKPMLAPGVLAEFTVTVEQRGPQMFIRLYDYNHENIPDNMLLQAMIDAFVTGLIKKGADRRRALEYIDQRWRANTGA